MYMLDNIRFTVKTGENKNKYGRRLKKVIRNFRRKNGNLSEKSHSKICSAKFSSFPQTRRQVPAYERYNFLLIHYTILEVKKLLAIGLTAPLTTDTNKCMQALADCIVLYCI